MSHSQFHSIRVLILRHAWLNLLDKHMTTGRINQVTTLRELGALSRAAIPTRGRRHRDTQLARTLQNDLACFEE